MYRNGTPLREIKLKTIDTGISFEDVPGIIPLYHEIDACKAANYQYYGNWQELSGQERATLIAHYYVKSMIEQNVSDAQQKAAERQARRRKK